jgi:hypothetical protein
MENNNDKGNLERLCSLYESNSNNFQKLFAILIGLGLFFLLTVVLPYFLNIYEYEQNKEQSINENKTIQQGNTTIRNLNMTIINIKKDIENLSKNVGKTKSMMNSQIKIVNSSLDDADKLLANINDPKLLVTLKNILNNTEYSRNGTLIFAGIALESFNSSISIYKDRIDQKNQELNSTNITISNSKSNLKKAIDKRDMLIDRLHNLTERWKEIQSPFGNLPIDFSNLMAVFPLGLSSGFLLCSIWLAESIRLRAIIHGLLESDPTSLPKLGISKAYPLWIDPENIKQNKKIQFLLFSIPVIIFVLSFVMITFAWENAPTAPFPSANESNKSIYYVSYAACFGLVFYGYLRVWLQTKNYRRTKTSWNS